MSRVKKLKQFSLSSLLLLRLTTTFSLLISSAISLSYSHNNNPDLITLLAFKSSSDPSNSLSFSWSNSSISDPCSWFGVTCDPTTQRVTKLVLNHLNLTGSFQILTRLTHLRHLSLHHNRLSSVPQNLSSFPNLKHFYLSHNLLAGKFPPGILTLRRLHRLDLSFNQFSGEIPVIDLTHLPHLLTLRLEFNSFTGTLNSIDPSPTISISDFNVSGNELVGEIPNWLSKFPATSFSGNKNLCGKPLPFDCPNKTIPSDRAGNDSSAQIVVSGERKKGLLKDPVVLIIICVDVVAAIVTILTLSFCCYYKRGYRYRERKKNNIGGVVVRESEGDNEMVYFEGCKGFAKVDDLLKASAEMLGKGSVGTTYKVVMDGGDAVVVVKRVRERRGKKDVDGVLRVIGGLRHPNVVSLRAYYCSKDELLLVSDFLTNGSLHSLLHGNRGPGRTPLDWTARLKLASGSAQGLAFLHSYNHSSKLFHGHFTSSNILVDHLGNACISDIGLHQLFPMPSPSNTAYKSPELRLNNNGNRNSKFMQKCDVYSFGVVLLEILTGKLATSDRDQTSLVKWVKSMGGEKWRTWEVLDFELLRYREREEEMVALLKVALICLSPLQKDRPKMGLVCKMIEDIRRNNNGGRGGGTLSPANDLSSVSSSDSESSPNFNSS